MFGFSYFIISENHPIILKLFLILLGTYVLFPEAFCLSPCTRSFLILMIWLVTLLHGFCEFLTDCVLMFYEGIARNSGVLGLLYLSSSILFIQSQLC